MLDVARDMTPRRAGGAWTERVAESRSTLLRRTEVLVEIMTERDTDAAMGVAIDAINEYEPILDGTFERSGAVVGALPEGD